MEEAVLGVGEVVEDGYLMARVEKVLAQDRSQLNPRLW